MSTRIHANFRLSRSFVDKIYINPPVWSDLLIESISFFVERMKHSPNIICSQITSLFGCWWSKTWHDHIRSHCLLVHKYGHRNLNHLAMEISYTRIKSTSAMNRLRKPVTSNHKSPNKHIIIEKYFRGLIAEQKISIENGLISTEWEVFLSKKRKVEDKKHI